MSDHRFVVTDIDFQPFKEEDEEMRVDAIKEEAIKDDDILLFTQAEMEEFSTDSANFQIVEDLVGNEGASESSAFNIQPFGDMSQLAAENFAKLPLDLGTMCKIEAMKTDRSLSHFIKYKVQDGKHTKVWECGICSKEFGHQYTLMRHLPTHTDERKFRCNTCGKAFRQMSTLSQHRAIHSAERPYVCEICHKTFNRVSTLISHRKTHTGHKPHRCHLCNKAFHQKGNLRNHIFTHTNERPYKCDVCSKGFNQMSNLMCHKLKAHQRADKPRYMCQICGKDFQMRMGLRNHEQYQHGVQNPEAGSVPTRIKYTNGVLVDPINTAAMQHALATNQTPFALLRPLNGIPVLVRVLAAGDKQMLVPATAEDLKKHGQITITPKVENEDQKENVSIKVECHHPGSPNDEDPPNGSTVQIKIPVVATVVQRCGKDGNVCMAVQSPGPSGDGLMHENYIFTTTASENQDGCSEQNVEDEAMTVDDSSSEEKANEYLEVKENGYDIKARFYNQHFSFDQELFQQNRPLDSGGGGGLITIQNHNQFKDIDPESLLNMGGAGGGGGAQIYEVGQFQDLKAVNVFPFKILEKPQTINLSETDAILDGNALLYDTDDFILP